MKTEIVNSTGELFDLKEGNAGAFRFFKQLKAGEKVSIKVDPNATYREYMVATTPTPGKPILLTSDDFSEFKVITIQKDPGDPVNYIYKSSEPRRPGASKAGRTPPTPATAEAGGTGATPVAAEAGGSDATPAAARTGGSGATAASSKPALGNSNRSERVPWYKKLKSWFK